MIQSCLLEAALGERIGLSDDEWAIIGALLPSEHGRGCRPAQDNRLYFEGMMWIARTGSQWRHLPDEYGKWNSVFRRYQRWVTTDVDLPPRQSLSHNESLAVKYDGPCACTSASGVMAPSCSNARRACAGVRFPKDEWGRAWL